MMVPIHALQWYRFADTVSLSASALRNLLIACRFSAFFLVVSIKKRTFAASYIN